MMHDDISIVHLIERHHPCNQQASSMESTSIIHGINKHHVINKHQECYSIIDNIASLIATFKRYALVFLMMQLIIVGLPTSKYGLELVKKSIISNVALDNFSLVVG